MDLGNTLARARRGLREERRLYLVAISSLTVAFLCLGGALLAVRNLSALADVWGRSSRMTVYLEDSAREEDVAQLRVSLEGLSEVARAEHVSAAEARAQFLAQSESAPSLASLPVAAFPASIEVTLLGGTPISRTDAIAARITGFPGVSDVETYRGFFGRLESLLRVGSGIALVTALLVGLCVLAVIANTIRLAVARRRQEIEVMKLCGATDGFVRGPFVLEGVLQGFLSALLAVVVLSIAFASLRGDVDATVSALTGVRLVFLSPVMLAGLVLGGATVGALGSALSLRRYLVV